MLGLLAALLMSQANNQNLPPDVQQALDRMKQNKQVDQGQVNSVRGWSDQKLGAAEGLDGGLIPSDVQEILRKMQQGGMPTKEDTAKLKAWGDHAKQHKEDLLNSEKDIERTLNGARPEGGGARRGQATDNLMHGRVHVAIEQDIDHQGNDTSHAHNSLNVTIPVAYLLETDMKRGGDFKLTLLSDGSAAPTGSLNVTNQSSSQCDKSNASGSAPVSGWAQYFKPNPKIATYNPPIIIISRPAKAPRAYLLRLDLPLDGKGTMNGHSQHTCKPESNDDGTGPLLVTQVVTATYDNLISGVMGGVFGPQNAVALKEYGVPSIESQSPELKAMFDGVQFQFDADGFPQQFAKGTFSGTATYRYTLKTKDSDGKGSSTVKSTTTLTFESSGAPKLKAYIEPDDLATYRDWVPQGHGPLPQGQSPDDTMKGNSLKVHLSLVNTETKTEVTTPFNAVYNLRNTSKMQGWCGNYPATGGDTRPDLRFVQEDNAPGNTLDGDGQQLNTPDGGGSETVTITSFDYGAFGSLQAQVTLSDGVTLDAELRPEVADIAGKPNALTIPPDKNNNDIADKWERDQGVYDDSLPASWDGEKQPVGPSDGDGLTLYEEYRGVFKSDDGKSESHFRVPVNDKKKKEFFLVDSSLFNDGSGLDLLGPIKVGLAARETAAGDHVYVFRMKSELAAEGKQFRMNPNSNIGDAKHFGVKHYAVAFSSDTSSDGIPQWPPPLRHYASTASPSGDVPRSPDSCAGIVLHPLNTLNHAGDLRWLLVHPGPYTKAWLKARNTTQDKVIALLANKTDYFRKTMAFTVMHESGHSLGRHHHQRGTEKTGVACDRCPAPCEADFECRCDNANSPEGWCHSRGQLFDWAYDPPNACPMHYYDSALWMEFEVVGGYFDPSKVTFDAPPGDVDYTKPGWIQGIPQVPYKFDDDSSDDGVLQGGQGAPRYKE